MVKRRGMRDEVYTQKGQTNLSVTRRQCLGRDKIHEILFLLTNQQRSDTTFKIPSPNSCPKNLRHTTLGSLSSILFLFVYKIYTNLRVVYPPLR